MHMSKACLPPIQPPISGKDRAHPLYPAYSQHRAFCSNNLIEALSFEAFVYQTEAANRLAVFERHPRFKEWQRWMQDNKGGSPGRNPAAFPKNFQMWLDGARW